jgi:type I restriction enzyme, S subunit
MLFFSCEYVKLDELLGKVEACQKRLDNIPALLKRFRRAVLKAAGEGILTESWRAQPDPESDLPNEWKWVPLESVLPKGGIFDGPFGSNLKTSDYSPSGVRVVRLENIGQLRFNSEKHTYISHTKYSSLRKHTVGQGDIIFASFIDEEVRACMLPDLQGPAIAKADCFCIRPMAEFVDPTYLTYQLVCGASYSRLVSEIHGATRPRINTTQLRKLEIRLAPIQEQQEIVRRVKAMLSLAEIVESRFQDAAGSVTTLTQSILAKAFRGELVAQEKED